MLCQTSCSQIPWPPSQPLKLEKGVKRKADNTICGTTYDCSNSTSAEFKSAKISTRRESCRQIKKPMRSETDEWVPYLQNNIAPMLPNAAITHRHASHKSKEKWITGNTVRLKNLKMI